MALRRLLALALLGALALPHVAAADPAGGRLPRARHGLLAGLAVAAGNLSCDGPDCDGFRESGGGSLQVGYMLRPRLGVLLDVWAMTSRADLVDLTYVTSTVNVRWFALPVLWVQAGLGNGHAEIRYGGLTGRGDDVPVVQLAAGLEVLRGRTWAVDVQLKVAQGTSTNETGDVTTGRSSGLGVAWTYYAPAR